MFSKVLVLCALVTVSQAGLLAVSAPVHYSPATAVSSQNIVRHDEAAPAYRAAPAVATYAAPAVAAYRAAPAVATYAAPAVAAYRAAPAVATYAAPAVATYRAPAVATYAAPALAYRAAEVDTHPKYEYTYSVADSHTGDNKSQQESRDGDVVRGSYSLHESDGSIRTVEYSADDHSGFNAVVHNTAPTAAPAHAVIRPVSAYYH